MTAAPDDYEDRVEESRLDVAARKVRYILDRHVQPRVGWMLRQPDSDPPLAASPHNAPLYRIDWMCEGAGLPCAECAAEHYRAEGPHTDWRHRSCIVCGDTVGLVPLTATVRVIQQVRISGGRSVAGLLETTPIVWGAWRMTASSTRRSH